MSIVGLSKRDVLTRFERTHQSAENVSLGLSSKRPQLRPIAFGGDAFRVTPVPSPKHDGKDLNE